MHIYIKRGRKHNEINGLLLDRKIIYDLLLHTLFAMFLEGTSMTSTIGKEGGIKSTFLKPEPNHKVKVSMRSTTVKSF